MSHVHHETGYGCFCGGDPRNFSCDPECSTEAERAKHKADCDAWDRGERPDVSANVPYWTNKGGMVAHVTPAGYGLGVYTLEVWCDDPDCDESEPPQPVIDPAQLSLIAESHGLSHGPSETHEGSATPSATEPTC